MRIVEQPDVLKKCRRTSWESQQTFRTPLEDLRRFVDVIMSASGGIERATVGFDQVVFDPSNDLVPLFAKYRLPKKYQKGVTIEAESPAEVPKLLQAVLSEWFDFICVPSPQPFVIYADHDEFITFLAHRKNKLKRLVDSLTSAGFQAVDYVRAL